MRIEPNREALARYGIDASQVMDVVAALGGRPVGQVFEGRARFPIRVRIPEPWRTTPSLLEQLPVAQAAGTAGAAESNWPTSLSRKPARPSNTSRAAAARLSPRIVRGRDVAGFVNEAQRAIRRHVRLPPNYELRWGGDFQNLQVGQPSPGDDHAHRLVGDLSAPAHDVRFGAAGGVDFSGRADGGLRRRVCTGLRGMSFSISAGVGFIALFGVAVLNGLVWVSAAEHDARRRDSIRTRPATTRPWCGLRPVLMTALVAGLGFLPMALSTSDGAELQRPLATVVIGGVITSTLLTSLVLPAIYPWFSPKTGAFTALRISSTRSPTKPRPVFATAEGSIWHSAEISFVARSSAVTVIRAGLATDES